MATSIASLFSGVKGINDSTLNAFKTPEQVREEQLSKLRERSSAQATLLGNLGQRGSTALPGIIGSFAASQLPEQAVDLNQAARRGMLGLGSIAGAAGRPGVQEALQQAAVSPEERQAATVQDVMKSVDPSDPASFDRAATQLQNAGLTSAAQAMKQQAEEARSAILEQQQQRFELRKSIAETATVGIKDVDVSKFTPESLGLYQASIAAGYPDLSVLQPRMDANPTEFEKSLMQAYPNDPAKRSELMKQYVEGRAKGRDGVTVNLNDQQVNKALVELNTQGLEDYVAYARGGERQAQEIDAAAEVVFDAVVGGGSTWIAALEGLARQAGVNLPGDFGSLTKRSQIERLVNNEVLQAAGLIKGALSDKDLQFLQGSVGSLGDSPEAIRVALKRLANKKRIAAGMVKRFSGEKGSEQLATGLVDYASIEDEIATEMQLQNPNLFGASFIQKDGTVNPEIVNEMINQGTQFDKSTLGDISSEAQAALEAAIEKRMKELGLL